MTNVDDTAILHQLLDAWSLRPDPVVADAIDVLDRRFRVEPPTGTQVERAQWAREQMESDERLAVTSVMTIIASIRIVHLARDLLDGVLEQWALDPRVGSAVVRWFDRPPWLSAVLWRRVFKLANALPDQRLRDLDPQSLVKRMNANGTSLMIARRWSQLASVPPGASDADLRCAMSVLNEQQTQVLPARSLEALSAHSLNDPTDLAKRLVWADALCEANHPRGEFIQLQMLPECTPAQRRRMKALLKEHESSWLDGFDHILLKSGRRWEAGVLVEARFRGDRHSHWQELSGDPRWNSLRCIHLGGTRFRTLAEALKQQPLPGLTAISGIRYGDELHALFMPSRTNGLRHLTLASFHGPWGAQPEPESQIYRTHTLHTLTTCATWTSWLPWLAAHTRCEQVVVTTDLHWHASPPLAELLAFQNASLRWELSYEGKLLLSIWRESAQWLAHVHGRPKGVYNHHFQHVLDGAWALEVQHTERAPSAG